MYDTSEQKYVINVCGDVDAVAKINFEHKMCIWHRHPILLYLA